MNVIIVAARRGRCRWRFSAFGRHSGAVGGAERDLDVPKLRANARTARSIQRFGAKVSAGILSQS
jgi:hypothetical protein